MGTLHDTGSGLAEFEAFSGGRLETDAWAYRAEAYRIRR